NGRRRLQAVASAVSKGTQWVTTDAARSLGPRPGRRALVGKPMALVKTSQIAAGSAVPHASAPPAPRGAGPRGGAPLSKDKLPDRIAAATEEMASGLAEASAAAEELRRSMEQIASGAEEAAGGSQEQVAAIGNVLTNLTTARSQADASRRRTEALQLVLTETAV